MKNVIKLLFGVLLVASCTTKDLCKDVVCGTSGSCNEGICICENGYEKDAAGLCNIEVRAKFLGAWTVSDDCSASGTSGYNISAANSTSIMDIKITNFWGVFKNFTEATVTGTNSFNIPRQAPDADGYYIESIGDATISGNTITAQYVISNEKDATAITRDTCTATWVK